VTITREQVADLREGDVVELASDRWGGASMRGPLVQNSYGDLTVGRIGYTTAPRGFVVRTRDGSPSGWADAHTLTVVSRAPKPMYVNHPRTRPARGDVVRGVDQHGGPCWDYVGGEIRPWSTVGTIGFDTRRCRDDLPTRLLLVIDGETGRVVP
jgi:hypothetical protein